MKTEVKTLLIVKHLRIDDNWCDIEERTAPVMNNKPLDLFIDKDCEYLSFLTIFCGERRVDNKGRLVPVHYSTVCKWEMRSWDRRVAQSVPNIFYKLKTSN